MHAIAYNLQTLEAICGKHGIKQIYTVLSSSYTNNHTMCRKSFDKHISQYKLQ